MKFEALSGFGDVLAHKSGWMITGIISGVASVSIPVDPVAVTNVSTYEIARIGAICVTVLTCLKLTLACYEHVLNIKQKRRDLAKEAAHESTR